MANVDNPQEELLKEARRTTHAARAIARFVLLIVTYQVFAAIAWVIAVVTLAGGGEDGATAFIVIGGLISIIGLFHSLSAGYEELGLSAREQPEPEPDALPAESESAAPVERGLRPGICDCRKIVRWANTSKKDGVKYCMSCERAISV
jgi:hypothetical protein